MTKDPLEVLVKSHDYIEGYKNGLLEAHASKNEIANSLRELADKLTALGKNNRTHKSIKVYGILNGSLLLREKFETKDEAWARIEEICGDKINPIGSSFKIIHL